MTSLRMNMRVLAILATLILTGCETAYYSAMEKVGYHKREILVDRIEEATESQEDAQQQFKSAIEQFSSVVHFDGGDLEKLYNQLNDEYENSVEAADEIKNRVDAVEQVADALFEEWEGEIELYTSTSLKRDITQKLKRTKRDYGRLIRAMRKAEGTLHPVLNSFRDQVLYLKHNLNARAIASLKSELKSIDNDVQALIRTMDQSINEAKRFVSTLKEN